MKCPHCNVSIHPHAVSSRFDQSVGRESDAPDEAPEQTWWEMQGFECPSCNKAVVVVFKQKVTSKGFEDVHMFPAYPQSVARPPAPPEVPNDLAEDFDEAGAVLSLSPKASAALSRRCLQALLRDQGYMQKDLAPAIQAVLDSRSLPSGLAGNLDAIRNIGNFAAHPMKDTNSGAVLPVETHEAEWNLEVLEGLFDFYYVQPAKDAARRAALNAKLQTANKPPLK